MSDEPWPALLVVDDDDLVREALGSALRRSGFVVRLAAGGEEAVELYRRHGDIGAVLLDVRMPGMDGPEALAALRQINPAVRCCFMSSYIEGYSREELLALGANDFFLKPISLAELVVIIRHLFGRPEDHA
jgi:two-component system response regulator AtoC